MSNINYGFKNKVENFILENIDTICNREMNWNSETLDEGVANNGMDSLDFIELVMELEEQFDVSILEEEVDQCRTIRDLIILVDKKVHNRE